MELSKTASLIIYRIRERGLEVFMLGDEKQQDWTLPNHQTAQAKALPLEGNDKYISLDPVQQSDGKLEEGLAVEGDWHDIPSLKSLLIEDVEYVKVQIKQMGQDALEKGAFVAIKEAFKRVAPHQYEMLKELKDIVSDRNSVKDL